MRTEASIRIGTTRALLALSIAAISTVGCAFTSIPSEPQPYNSSSQTDPSLIAQTPMPESSSQSTQSIPEPAKPLPFDPITVCGLGAAFVLLAGGVYALKRGNGDTSTVIHMSTPPEGWPGPHIPEDAGYDWTDSDVRARKDKEDLAERSVRPRYVDIDQMNSNVHISTFVRWFNRKHTDPKDKLDNAPDIFYLGDPPEDEH